MGKISKNELNTSLITKIEEIDLKANISDLETTNSQLAQKVSKTGDTMTGNLNVPALNNKTPAYAIAPAETIITSGFAAGWSGDIRYKKSQEGLVIVTMNLVKSSDIATGVEALFTLPTEFRPSRNLNRLINLYTVSGGSVSNSFANVRIGLNGQIQVYPVVGTNLVNARYIFGFTCAYFAG